MLHSEGYGELRNGKRFYKSIERTMSNHGLIEKSVTAILSKNVKKASEIQNVDPRNGQRAN